MIGGIYLTILMVVIVYADNFGKDTLVLCFNSINQTSTKSQ